MPITWLQAIYIERDRPCNRSDTTASKRITSHFYIITSRWEGRRSLRTPRTTRMKSQPTWREPCRDPCWTIWQWRNTRESNRDTGRRRDWWRCGWSSSIHEEEEEQLNLDEEPEDDLLNSYKVNEIFYNQNKREFKDKPRRRKWCRRRPKKCIYLLMIWKAGWLPRELCLGSCQGRSSVKLHALQLPANSESWTTSTSCLITSSSRPKPDSLSM